MIAWKVVGPECNGGEGGRGGRYQEGRPAVELAFELDFPPTLVARLLLQDLLALTRQVPPSPPPSPHPRHSAHHLLSDHASPTYFIAL